VAAVEQQQHHALAGVAVIEEAGVVAVVRARTAADAVEVSRALVDGGVRAIEVTFTTPGATTAITTLTSELEGRATVGAGTVVNPEQARAAIGAGAAFVVSPGYDAEVVDCAGALGCLALPGVATPTEVMAAVRRGHDALKLFPGSIGGPGYLRALAGPFTDVRFMPTGGVTLDSIPVWLSAGAFAIGVGGSLVPPWLRDGAHRDQVVAAAGEVVDAVAGWRSARVGAEAGR